MNNTIIDATSNQDKTKLFECLVEAEEERRAREMSDVRMSLEEHEKTYFGPSVGAIRRACNRVTMSHLRFGGDLLDYGCGSSWWKEDYWPRFSQVYAVEVNKRGLEDVAERYPQARLVHTRNGLVDTKALDDKKFDVVVSSGVIGYLLPVQARCHLRSCHELLKPGGQLMLTLVRACNAYCYVNANRFTLEADTSFSYAYTADELKEELRRAGFNDIRYHCQGVRLPVSWKMNQALYRAFPGFMASVAPRVLPFLKLSHMLTATK